MFKKVRAGCAGLSLHFLFFKLIKWKINGNGTPDVDIADSCIKSFSFFVLEKKSCAKEADEGKEKMPSPQIPLFFYFTDWS